MKAKTSIEDWSKPKKLQELEELANQGLGIEEIAKSIGIVRRTLYSWMDKNEHILHAIKKGRERSNEIVENKLFKNATGYHYTEQVATKIKNSHYDANGKKVEKEEIVLTEVQKYKTPETVAQIFWLKNRMPNEWRDRQEVYTIEDEEVTQSLADVFKEHSRERNEKADKE